MVNRNIIMIAITWLFITSFYCYQYILRLLPNSIMPELIKKFSIGAYEFGEFAGIYYVGYILMQIPFGILLSRFGGKIVMPISILIATLGVLPIAGDSWQLAILGRFFIGVGASAAIIGAFQIFRIIFPEHFTVMLGTLVCVSILTAVYLIKPLTVITNNIGVEEMVKFLVIGGGVLALATYFILPKMPISKSANIWIDIKLIMSNKKIIFTSILAGLMVAPLEGFADAWGTSFIRTVYGIERYTADSIVGTILTGMCVGSLVLPYIAEKMKSYYGVTMFSGLIMAACFGFLLTGMGEIFTLYIISLLIGVFSAYQVVIVARISTYVRMQLSGMAAAVGNMIVMAFGYIFHTSIAYVIENDSNSIVEDSIRTYSTQAFIEGISIIPISLSLASIGFAIIAINNRKNERG